ncbi:MAG: hypothetical protein BGO49_10280 [Planctomycetales bacterium 71-10]|nr:MAG: hypothetical protein BGO49_10280 [Planctomycetales bacterium 71-10]
MEPFTIGLATAAGIGAIIGVLWNYFAAALFEDVIPFIRRHISEILGEAIFQVVNWMDGKVTLARSGLKHYWRTFREQIMGATSTYKKTGANSVTVTTRTAVKVSETHAEQVTTVRRDVPIAELPPKLREQVLLEAGGPVTVDVAAGLSRLVAQKADREGIKPEELDLKL